MKTCPNCSKPVIGRPNKVYCGSTCKQVANKRRWRHRYPEKAKEQSRRGGKAFVKSGKNREKCRRWREANKEKHAELNKAWKLANPGKVRARRQRRRGAKVEPGLGEWMERQAGLMVGKVCFYCGTDCGDGFHWDHRVPLVAGGGNSRENLVVSCPTCNMRKGARLPESVFCEEIFG